MIELNTVGQFRGHNTNSQNLQDFQNKKIF